MTDHHGKYGPRTEIVERVIERAGRLTDDEKKALADAWGTAYNTVARDEAVVHWNVVCDVRSAAHAALGTAAGEAAWAAVWNAIRAAAWNAANKNARVAARVAWDAALSATIADLVGQRGLTYEHLEILAGPWRQVITDVDPLEDIGRRRQWLTVLRRKLSKRA